MPYVGKSKQATPLGHAIRRGFTKLQLLLLNFYVIFTCTVVVFFLEKMACHRSQPNDKSIISKSIHLNTVCISHFTSLLLNN